MNNSVLRNINYGMYAVGVKDGDKPSACIVNSVTQIASSQENLLAISINKTSYSACCIRKNGLFTVSVLSTDTPASIIGVLGLVTGKKVDKLKNVRHRVLIEGVPVIKENTCCWFLCKLVKTVEVGNQYIFVGKVEAGSDITNGEPMSYNYYINELKGTVPVESPAHVPPAMTSDKTSVECFECSVCGYIYNDPNFGFDELEKEWKCPSCKMPKSVFVRK